MTHRKQALVDLLEKAGVKVKPLVWVKSHIEPWDGDYHTVPTWGTIRGLANEDYRLSYPGGFGVFNSPDRAKAAGDNAHQFIIFSALIAEEGE